MADYATVGGGFSNTANSLYSTVPGGRENIAAGDYSFAAGRRAKANHAGAFVWGDSTDSDVVSLAANSFTARVSGGMRIYTNAIMTLGVSLDTDAVAWGTISDRNKKKDFQPVAGESILDRLRSMPITTWRYIWERSDSVPHIGPVAQDFKALFYPGRDNKTISTLEFDGVAFAAIKALEQRTAQLQQENAALKTALERENAAQNSRIAKLEAALLSADGDEEAD